jgi:hypothetical protein
MEVTAMYTSMREADPFAPGSRRSPARGPSPASGWAARRVVRPFSAFALALALALVSLPVTSPAAFAGGASGCGGDITRFFDW